MEFAFSMQLFKTGEPSGLLGETYPTSSPLRISK